MVAIVDTRRLHVVRQVPGGLSLRCHRAGRGRTARRSPQVVKTACKGCGGCVPVCATDAIDLLGYTDAQIKAMIDGFLEVSCS